MSLARNAARGLILAVLVVGIAAMHTLMPGACPTGDFTPMVGAGMSQTAAATTAMATSVTAPLTSPAVISTAAQAYGSGAPGRAGHAMSEVCRARITPVHPTLAGMLAALVAAGLMLARRPGRARPWLWAGWWWPPPVPRASLGIWRI